MLYWDKGKIEWKLPFRFRAHAVWGPMGFLGFGFKVHGLGFRLLGFRLRGLGVRV